MRDAIHVDLIADASRAWEERLGDVPRDVYHTAGYHAYAEGSREGHPHLLVVEHGERGLAWPYLLRSVSEVGELAGSDASDITSVYGYPGPLAWGCEPGDPFLARAWSEIQAVWREQRVVSAFTRFHPILDNASLVSGVPMLREGTTGSEAVLAVGPTVSVDCTLSDDEARQGYARALQQHIAAGRRAGLATVHDEEWTHLPAFTRLYLETMSRSDASEYYHFDQSDFERLRDALAGHLHLLVTCLGDDLGAAGLFTEFGGIVQAHLVGTSRALLALSPFKVLLDDARMWARARDNTVLHLGGGRGGREDSLLKFKGEFSPRRHVFHVGRWIFDEGGYGDLVEARRSGSPDGRVLDASHFPGYRAAFVEADEVP